MTNYLKNTANRTLTENGAAALSTTGSNCLDLFASIGALRNKNEQNIVNRFVRAFSENRDMALKLLFYARDIRGGLGERNVFRVILKWLADNEPNVVIKNMDYIAEYGRYDDLLVLLRTPCEEQVVEYIKNQLDSDIKAMNDNEKVSLLAKWLPSINATDKNTVHTAKHLADLLGMSCVEYRKTLSALRTKLKIIENNLREKDYTFDYEKQTSRSLFKYKEAFYRNDYERYSDFLNRVNKGEAKLKADNVYPYELINPYLSWNHSLNRNLSEHEKNSLNATWKSFSDFGGDENAIAVVDTSGSMYCGKYPLPASVAISLGLYFAERNKGCFKNCFIEFSKGPRLIELEGETFVDKLRYILTFNEIANTDIEAVFDLILESALKNNVSQEDLPKKIVIISDMEFDHCVDNSSATVFENAKKRFEDNGYKLPNVVFWNVDDRNNHRPVGMNQQGVLLVSGATPKLFAMVAGKTCSPYEFMIETLYGERYEKISA